MIAMITTCPACRTAFRVNNEQLAARDGQVRCGRCSTVFDAREALHREPQTPETGSPIEDSPAQAGALVLPESAPVAPTATGVPGILNSESTARAPNSAPLASESRARPPETPAPTHGDEVPALTAADQPRVRHQAAWAAASTLLVLALMAQVAFHYRGEIALVFPRTRPALAELCANLDCGIPLPQRAEMISIESSDLQADPANPSIMVLTAMLRNRAAFTQSLPSLELTLTDSNDQPLARRILWVRDYLPPGASTDAGFTGNSELSIKVFVEAASLKATGYRLYLFFP